jgi:hypothetical protein
MFEWMVTAITENALEKAIDSASIIFGSSRD